MYPYLPDRGIKFSLRAVLMLRCSGRPFLILDLNRLASLLESYEEYSVVVVLGVVVDRDLEYDELFRRKFPLCRMVTCGCNWQNQRKKITESFIQKIRRICACFVICQWCIREKLCKSDTKSNSTLKLPNPMIIGR